MPEPQSSWAGSAHSPVRTALIGRASAGRAGPVGGRTPSWPGLRLLSPRSGAPNRPGVPGPAPPPARSARPRPTCADPPLGPPPGRGRARSRPHVRRILVPPPGRGEPGAAHRGGANLDPPGTDSALATQSERRGSPGSQPLPLASPAASTQTGPSHSFLPRIGHYSGSQSCSFSLRIYFSFYFLIQELLLIQLLCQEPVCRARPTNLLNDSMRALALWVTSGIWLRNIYNVR